MDTGAGPNVLSWHALIKMGYSKKDLQPNRYKLSMVDDSELTTKGYLPNLRVCLADAELEVPCTVVKGLGTDELILGREFLNKYDVLLDLPRRELTIRNPHGRCQTIETLEEIKESHFLAVPRMQAKIAPETICCVNYDVKEAQQVTLGGRGMRKGSWLATVESLDDYYQEKNVTIPKAVLTVRNGVVAIPLLNSSWKEDGSVELPPRRGLLRVKALREVYCRRVVDDDAEEMCYTLRIDEKDEIVSAAWEGSRDSDMDSQCTSEPPIEVAKHPTRFVTRPRIEHLRRTLSDDTMHKLENLLDEHEDVFSKDKTDVGRTSGVQHEIRLAKGVEPHRESYRRLHPHKRECADRQIQEFLDKGFISPSQSPFSLGVVMIKKPDGTYRMSVDFRKLNAMTEKESYPLPKLEETLEKLSETKYYSTLDMSRGTWQIPLSEESKEHTAFVTHRGQYHWNYLPAGLCNDRATFQRLMTKVLANVAQSYGNVVLSYTNDIVIASRTEAQHLEQLEAVLKACKNANLKLKALKCHQFEKEMKFMGRVITPEGVKPDPENVEDVLKWKPPTDKKELGGFLNFASYYREFIKGYAEIASPLQSMKKLNVEFTWGKEQQDAFERIKQALMYPPVLAMPVQDGSYVLDTDASDVAIAGILHQWQHSPEKKKPVLRVIGYASRSLTETQLKFGAAKLEMFAALKMIERFSPCLGNAKFLLRVDCSALTWLQTCGNENPLAARWVARLEGFDFTVEQRARGRHRNADGLSKRTNELQKKVAGENAEDKKQATLPFLDSEDLSKLLTRSYLDTAGVPGCLPGDPLSKSSEEGMTPSEANAPEKQQVSVQSMVDKTGEGVFHRDAARPGSILPEMPDSDTGVLKQPSNIKITRIQSRYTLEELRQAQQADPVYVTMMRALQMPKDATKTQQTQALTTLTETQKKWFNKNRSTLRMNDKGILLLDLDDGVHGSAVIVPNRFKFDIMQEAHERLAHQGATKTAEKMARHYQWPGYGDDVKRHVASCITCQEAKPPQRILRAKLQPIVTNAPGEILMIDYEKMTKAHDGSAGVLMMVDHYSKYCMAASVPAFTAEEAAKAIWFKWIQSCGIPDVIHSDKGSHFENSLLQELCLHLGAVKTHTSGYHPQGNGLVERMNRTIVKCLAVASGQDQTAWPRHLTNKLQR